MLRDIKSEWRFFCHDQGGIWAEGRQKLINILISFLFFALFLPVHLLGFIFAGSGYYRLIRQ